MDLKQVLLTILKILISTWLIVQQVRYVDGAVLMGGHMDNSNNTDADLYDEYDYSESGETSNEKTNKSEAKMDSEEIPNPSPLVLPGYNLPENIFNHGKPFYVEKDPLTGKIDFSHKSPSLKSDDSDLYEYVDEEPSGDVYDKKNIDRKDGSFGYSSHKQADVNQLTPNFHDFLNLPVKYNPDKYVYPLISSSYASTKIQGSVNKFHNHKDTFGVQKTTTTKKPASSPSYYSTTSYFTPRTTQRTMATTPVTTTTTTKPTTIKRYPELTTPPANILHSSMSHPSFSEEYEYYDSPDEMTVATTTSKQSKPQDIYLTTEKAGEIYLTTKVPTTPSTTTRKIMSLFEQLFGDYDETVTTTDSTKLPSLFSNVPSQKLSTTSTTTYRTTAKPSSVTTTTQAYYPNIHAGPHSNILTGSNMGLENNYDYEDEDYSNTKIQDNIAVENKLHTKVEDSLSVEPLKPVSPITKLTPVNKTIHEEKIKTEKKPILDLNKNKPFSVKPTNYGDYSTDKPKYTTSTTTTTTTATTKKPPSTTTMPTTTPTTTTTVRTTSRVTSLPLGENHIGAPSLNRDPIIVATQNLREKLNSEKVKPSESPQLIVELPPQPQDQQRPITQLVPSSSNIHIAPGQDTVSFVVGHHQSVGDGGQYTGSALKESPFDNKPFRPLYGHEATYSSNTDTNRPQINIKPSHIPEAAGSAVTIQPLQNSEASLAIGMPVSGIKQVPGQVMDASLDNDGHVQFPKEEGNKVVFPEDKKSVQTNLIPPRLEPQQQPNQLPNQEVLKLNSKPMYHQLPSDLTPPKENDIIALPPRYGSSDRPMRPPWDPRPGHFYSGKPEYVRPPRPHPDVAYKRIDTLPNILPQFRPNMKHHYSVGPPPYYFDQRLNRQPLLERPSNRPIGFFEKMGPPPSPNVYKRFPQKIIHRGPPPPMPNIQERRPLPPPSINPNFDVQERRPLAQQPHQSLDENKRPLAEDRIMNEGPRRPELDSGNAPELNMYQTPPNIHIPNRRNGDGDAGVETLQMIQAKNEKEEEENNDENEGVVEESKSDTVKVTAQDPEGQNNSDKTIYKVYPVNAVPIIDVDKEGITTSEMKGNDHQSPQKSDNDFNFEHQDRNDAPILKPHPRPPTFPVKSDFPYPLERPDSVRHPDSSNNKINDIGADPYNFNNQWNSLDGNLESRIVTGGKINYGSNQISATLKTYTEKPIAIAYTPTESHLNADKYSMPNYGSPVIPEIRPGTVENADTGYGSENSEFTVHATMHTNPNHKIPPRVASYSQPSNHKFDHKIDTDVDIGPTPPPLDFQAPFQASMKLDAATNQGWAVVRDKNRSTTVGEIEATTLPMATTSEFDIENFKPQLIGGFKPLYTLPEMDGKKSDIVPEREEK